MQQFRQRLIVWGVAFIVGIAGAIAGLWGVNEYRRYQLLLQTTDALVQVVQQNIKAGKIDGLPPISGPVAPAEK